MVSPAQSSTGDQSEPIITGRFQFVSMQVSAEGNDPITRRLARSHAVKQALQNKRKVEQQSRGNFRAMTLKGKPRSMACKTSHAGALAVPFTLSPGALDPFQSLPIDSSRLQTLLGNYKSRQAPEPVFSVAEDLAFQSFRSVFRTGLVDPALLNAIMLSFVFASTGGSINQEGLRYQGQAISFVRDKMSSLDEATSESTIGAILLLAGVEASLRMKSQVQLHMGGVKLLLEICQTKSIYLSGGIKRAIFWQDLNSFILVGSSRIVDHTTFAELQWSRDPFSPSFSQLPPGFHKRSHLLTEEFVEVLEDVNALQSIRDLRRFSKGDIMQMAHINNHIAWIQSRLVDLPKLSPLLECCHLAAYLCSVMLCCTIWCGLVVPPHVSSQLLQKLQQSNDDHIWDDHTDLLLWLLCIGGAFAPAGTVRSNYILLLCSNHNTRFGRLYRSWFEVLGTLNEFIWSDRAFISQVKPFWENVIF